MSSEYFLTQINYKPEINNNKNVRIFGADFVKNNKNICKILFNNKEEDLQNYYEDINKDYNHKDEFNIVLKGLNEVTNMGSMFSRCIYLSSFYSLQDKSDSFNNTNIISTNHQNTISHSLSTESKKTNSIYDGCKSVTNTSNSSNDNTSTNTYILFNNRELLLNDISQLDTSKVENMSNMFNECKSLISLPDISNWNISNVTDLNGMFKKCPKLISLPDISK